MSILNYVKAKRLKQPVLTRACLFMPGLEWGLFLCTWRSLPRDARGVIERFCAFFWLLWLEHDLPDINCVCRVGSELFEGSSCGLRASNRRVSTGL